MRLATYDAGDKLWRARAHDLETRRDGPAVRAPHADMCRLLGPPIDAAGGRSRSVNRLGVRHCLSAVGILRRLARRGQAGCLREMQTETGIARRQTGEHAAPGCDPAA